MNLQSNLKIINSGAAPTTANLKKGEAAFGKVGTRYSIWGNSDDTIVDLIQSGSTDIQVVQTTGQSTTDVMSQKAVSDQLTSLDDRVTDAESAITTAQGDITGLSSDVSALGTDVSALQTSVSDMYTKAQVDAKDAETLASANSYTDTKVTAVYRYKGSVDTYEELPESGQVVGDVWNVVAKTTDYPAGTNFAWDGTAWDALGGSVDLSSYYTKTETDAKFALITTVDAISTRVSSVEGDIVIINGKIDDLTDSVTENTDDITTLNTTVSTLSGKVTALETKTEYLTDEGDGTKILTDDGTYQPLALTVAVI